MSLYRTDCGADTSCTEVAVIVGRWQIFHRGHETLLQAALQVAQRVVVVVGSAHRARDVRNPFTWQERRDMVLAALPPDLAARVVCVPVRDYFDDARWNAAVQAAVAAVAGTAAVTLVGFKKDQTSYYLDHFPAWRMHWVEPEVDTNATALRTALFAGPPDAAVWAQLGQAVSAGVLAYLQQWAAGPVFAERVAEQALVAQYRQRWNADVYLTADTVLVAQQQVLLIQRGGEIGRGLWALPGGFVDKNERFYHAAVRELQEETGVQLGEAVLRQAFQGSQVFDHPLRSVRGRLITQAFYLDLGDVPPPAVAAADDAQAARWVPIADLPQMEAQLFEDHAAILDHFVGVYG